LLGALVFAPALGLFEPLSATARGRQLGRQLIAAALRERLFFAASIA
jgi:hypothetical protein